MSGSEYDETVFCAHMCFLADIATPATAKEALAGDQGDSWKKAMDDEYSSLLENETWVLERLPAGRKSVGGKWTFRVKLDSKGEVSRFKARYVAKGYSQIPGRDFFETYAPTARLSTVRALFATAAQFDYELWQMDVKTAYLNAEIEEEVYLDQPEGYEERDGDDNRLYCRLKKTIYGLRQAGRNWNSMITEFMESVGFVKSLADQCLFIKRDGDSISYVTIWVDDIIVCGSNKRQVCEFKEAINSKFKITECKLLEWFLGMHVEQSRYQVSVDQTTYIKSILRKFGMTDCKPSKTPGIDKQKLTRAMCPEAGTAEQEEAQKFDYRGVIGSVMHLCVSTRPDLAFICSSLSQFLENPGREHIMAAKHVLRYLQETKFQKLVYRLDETGIKLLGFSDADWAGNVDNRKSTSGYCYFLQGKSAAISWSSKLQKTVALSTAEAEFHSLSTAAQECRHLQHLLEDMNMGQQLPTYIMADNQACIAMSKNPVQQHKTKHVAMRLHFVRDLIKQGQISLKYLPTDQMPADILTKCLGKLKTDTFRNLLSGVL